MIQCTESFLIENEYHFDERNHSEIADVVRCCLLIDWLMVFGCGCEIVCTYLCRVSWLAHPNATSDSNQPEE